MMNYQTQAALVSERHKTLLAEGARRSQQAQYRRQLGRHVRRSQLGARPGRRLAVAWPYWRPGGIENHRSFESGVVSYTRAGCPARAERRVDGLAEDHHVAGAVGGMARDAGGPLPDRHRPGPDRRHRHLPAAGTRAVSPTALSRWPTRCGSTLPAQPWSSGCPAACPAATWTISCSWHSAATWPSLSCCARRPGAEGPWPGPGTGCAECHCSAPSASAGFDVVPVALSIAALSVTAEAASAAP